MTYGKTIRIYLADGSPTGIRHAEVMNWTGQAMVCPRGRIGELADWEEAKRPGVYFLFGDGESGKQALYIGEAENVLKRLQSHVSQKDFWTRVVFFTSKDDNLTKSHVKYLESRLYAMAKEANRVELQNGNAPPAPGLPRSERDAMEEFLETLSVVLGALSFNALQPMIRAEQSESANSPEELRFTIPRRGVDARGSSTDEGFVVFAGSVADAEVKASIPIGARALRESLAADGALVTEAGVTRLTEDVLFSSPSTAAAVVGGGSYNGREVWKNTSGASLKALEEQAASAALGAAETTEE